MRGIILTTPVSKTRIAGVSLADRQRRMLQKAGIGNIQTHPQGSPVPSLVSLSATSPQSAEMFEASRPDRKLVGGPAALDGEEVLVLDGSVLLDDRIPSLLIAETDEAAACFPDEKGGWRFAGAARLRPEGLRPFLEGHLPPILDLSRVPTYRACRRRRIPFLWIPVCGPEDNTRCKRALLDAAQNGVLDWPAWYLHRPVENALVSRLAETPVTPNQVTLANNLVAFLGVYLFAQGAMIPGILAAVASGILDGVDGKLARVKQMSTRIGSWEHHLDKLYENGWYLAIALRLSEAGWNALPLFFLHLVANLADLVLAARFRKRFGIPFDDYGPFERRFRLIAGRRNTYIWTLLPFLTIGEPFVGYATVVLYALLSFSVRLWRFFLAARKTTACASTPTAIR